MPQVLDIEQAVLLLEIEPPFDKRDIQLARRRQAKQWHPDIAPPGKQLEHERHLKAINEAADQLEQLAEESRGGTVTPQRGEGQRRRGTQAPGRGGRAQLRRGAAPPRRRGGRRQARSVRLARARPLRRAPLRALPLLPGVGRRHGPGHLLHRRRRRHPAVGARLVPRRHPHGAGRLAAVRRLQQARPGRRPRPALHDRGQARARRGRLRARRPAARLRARRRAAQSRGAAAADDRLLAGRAVRGRRPRRARLDPARGRAARRRTGPPRASTRTWARSPRPSTPPLAETERAPRDGAAWERLGRLRLRTFDRAGARDALDRARAIAPDRAGAARPRARRAPRRRHRHRGLGVRAGDGARARVRARRGRASRTRSRARTARASASPPARRRSRSPTTPRSATCATRSSAPRRASSSPSPPPPSRRARARAARMQRSSAKRPPTWRVAASRSARTTAGADAPSRRADERVHALLAEAVGVRRRRSPSRASGRPSVKSSTPSRSPNAGTRLQTAPRSISIPSGRPRPPVGAAPPIEPHGRRMPGRGPEQARPRRAGRSRRPR